MHDTLGTYSNTNTELPLAPQIDDAAEMEVYARFMGHLRHVPNNRVEIKVLSAIQFTADLMGYSDAQIAKILVDLGLRASRAAFPADFLSFADASLMRSGWDVGGPSAAMHDLKGHWDRIGEDRFAAFRGGYSLLDERVGAV